MVSGNVASVERGTVAAEVKVEGPHTFATAITIEAVEDLNLKKGDIVSVMVKTAEVMIVKE